MPTAIVFPGQGAAVPGAGRAWLDHPAWQVVVDAEATLDRPLARLLLDADAAELATTRASQLAVLLHSSMVWEAVAPLLTQPPVAFAGHSLGQVTAVLASGLVDRADGFRLAALRADLSEASALARPGRMVALVGADPEVAEQACASVADAWVANDNAPGQVVVAGSAQAVAEVAEVARSLGVRRVLPLPVGHAFHTPLLADAAAGLRPFLDGLTFRSPTAPIVTNTDAAPHTTDQGWPERLARHLVEPVRWRASQHVIAQLGATTLLELGPGAVLAGLAKRTVPDVQVASVATPADVESLRDRLDERAAPRRRSGPGADVDVDLRAEVSPTDPSPTAPAARVLAEDLAVPERVITAPSAGVFRPSPPAEVTCEGEILHTGQCVGLIGVGADEVRVRSPFTGFFMGLLAHDGERVRLGQPLAWMRATTP